MAVLQSLGRFCHLSTCQEKLVSKMLKISSVCSRVHPTVAQHVMQQRHRVQRHRLGLVRRRQSRSLCSVRSLLGTINSQAAGRHLQPTAYPIQ